MDLGGGTEASDGFDEVILFGRCAVWEKLEDF